MGGIPFDHPVVTVMISIVLGFLAKYLWDRWFSQASRVTKKECELMRGGCTAIREFNKQEFMRLFDEQRKEHEARVHEDETWCERRKVTRSQTLKMLRVIMMTQLHICTHLKLDCEDIGKALVEMGEVD